MKRLYLLYFLIIAASCSIKEHDLPTEDYDTLFPFQGIEKPSNDRGNMNVKLCDPETVLENYKRLGEESGVEGDEYEITLECSFTETDLRGRTVENPTSKYLVRYINQNKELVTVTSEPGKADESVGEESEEDTENDEGEEEDESLENNVSTANGVQRMEPDGVYTVSFKAKSGFPVYLCVTGMGPRGSGVKATLKAVSVDGTIEIPVLHTEQYQNEEGPNMLKHPYCEYIVLP